jgi:hypothetical protein
VTSEIRLLLMYLPRCPVIVVDNGYRPCGKIAKTRCYDRPEVRCYEHSNPEDGFVPGAALIERLQESEDLPL